MPKLPDNIDEGPPKKPTKKRLKKTTYPTDALYLEVIKLPTIDRVIIHVCSSEDGLKSEPLTYGCTTIEHYLKCKERIDGLFTIICEREVSLQEERSVDRLLKQTAGIQRIRDWLELRTDAL